MIEVLKQMVEALEFVNKSDDDGDFMNSECSARVEDAIETGLKAIKELESQEPVATVTSETGADITMSWWHEPALPIGTKLYTHPPQRKWHGLTDEEREEATGWSVEHIEAKLKEKNT